MLDEITLRAVSRTIGANGYTTETLVDKTVFAQRKSIKRSEFYAANAAGQRVDVAYDIMADEYAGQTQVLAEGLSYKVIRTYETGGGMLELTLARE